jgi:hypothetical protein
MPELSPAAQAVWEAFNEDEAGVFVDYGEKLAAALEAAAKLEDIEPGFIGPCDESYGSYLHSCSITQRDFNYSLALEKNRAQVAAERKLLAIAAELRGNTTPTENN